LLVGFNLLTDPLLVEGAAVRLRAALLVKSKLSCAGEVAGGAWRLPFAVTMAFEGAEVLRVAMIG
jgi:hypothetical protein